MKYYIHHAQDKEGPFDLIAMMRRIRNGQLREQDPVSDEHSDTPRPAFEIPELGRFFEEIHGTAAYGAQQAQLPTFRGLLGDAFNFMQNQPRSLIFSSSFLLILLLIATGLNTVLPPLAAGIITYLLGMLGSAYLGYIFLRMLRGHPTDLRNLFHLWKRRQGAFLTAALLYAIGGGVGLVLLVVPGVFALAYLSLTPLLAMDKNLSAMASIEAVRKNIGALGADFLALLVGLQVTLLVAAVLVGLPLLIALPLVWIAQAILYDRYINVAK